MFIDKDRLLTPYRAVSMKKIRFSDHYSILVTFKNIPPATESVANRGRVQWNTNKIGGWEKYEELTSSNEVLNAIAAEVDTYYIFEQSAFEEM